MFRTPTPEDTREDGLEDTYMVYTPTAMTPFSDVAHMGPSTNVAYVGPFSNAAYVAPSSTADYVDPATIPGHPHFNDGHSWGHLYGNEADAYGWDLPGGLPFINDYPEYSSLANPVYPDPGWTNYTYPAPPQGVKRDSNGPQREDVKRRCNKTEHEDDDDDVSSLDIRCSARPRATVPSRIPVPSRTVAPSRTAAPSRIPIPSSTAAPGSASAAVRINKDGQPRKTRSARPPLCKWSSEDVLQKALMGLIIAANEDGVQLNFEKAAKYVGVTGPAFQQALLKIHKKLEAKGVALPPITMRWKGKAPSLIVVIKGRFDLD